MKLRHFFVLLACLTLITLPVLAIDVCQTDPNNRVNNCGFEYGFLSWTLTGNTGFTGVAGPPYNYSGNYGLTWVRSAATAFSLQPLPAICSLSLSVRIPPTGDWIQSLPMTSDPSETG